MAAAEGRHLGAGSGRVKAYQAGPAADGREQGGDVRIPDHRARAAGQCLEVHAVEDPGDAVAAPDAPHGVDRRIAEGAVQIGQPIGVGAGEVAVVIRGVRAQRSVRNPAHGTAPRPGVYHRVR